MSTSFNAGEIVPVEIDSDYNKKRQRIDTSSSSDTSISLYEYFTNGTTAHTPASFLCHSQEDFELPLVERKEAIQNIAEIWSTRNRAYNNAVVPCDRTLFALPVCVAIPGSGKTRLLEEYQAIFDKVEGMEGDRLGVLVLYLNGHGWQSADSNLSIEVSFSCRLLHRFYFEHDVSKPDFANFMKQVETEIDFFRNLNILDAIMIIRQKWETINNKKSDDIFNFFLGVDEYQTLANVEDGEKLIKLIEQLIEVSKTLIQYNVKLFPLFAGTEWDKIPFVGSSNPMVKQIKVPFLTLNGTLSIAQEIYPQTLVNPTFINSLLELGDNPRQLVSYSRQISQATNIRTHAIRRIGKKVCEDHYQRALSGCKTTSLMIILAFAIAGVNINPSDVANGETFTWQQFANRGILQIKESKICVPYSLAIYCANCMDGAQHLSEAMNTFGESLVELITGSRSEELEQWQKWGMFGGCFYCVKINALLLIGKTAVKISVIIGGNFRRQTDDLVVNLKPATLVKSEAALCNSLNLKSILEKDGTQVFDALNQDNCFIFLNGTNGTAVDIFFCLRLKTKNTMILVLDQRKRDNKTLNTANVEGLVNGMAATIPQTEPPMRPIFIIASSFAKTRNGKYPYNCVVFDREKFSAHLGPLTSCASSLSKINPNKSNQTQLQNVLNCTKEQAQSILARAKTEPFDNFNSFSAFLQAIGVEWTEEIKSWLLLVDSNEEVEELSDDEEMPEEIIFNADTAVRKI